MKESIARTEAEQGTASRVAPGAGGGKFGDSLAINASYQEKAKVLLEFKISLQDLYTMAFDPEIFSRFSFKLPQLKVRQT